MEIVLAIIVVGLLITGMAIGVLMGRPPITGSCGGVGKALGVSDYSCEICGDDPNKCEQLSAEPALGYEVGSGK